MTKQLITYLDRNEFNFEHSGQVINSICDLQTAQLSFYSSIEDSENIVSLLSEFWRVDPEQILVGGGEESILKDIIHYYCFHNGRQGKILMPDFSWWYYSSLAEESNSSVFSYPVRERGDLWESDPKEIIEMANIISPDILLLASPNNPTGNAFSFDELKRILKNVNKHIHVFIDQAYCKWDVESMTQTIDLLNFTPNVMIGRTFSKFFGLPGLRIGFCLLGERNQALYKYVHRYLGYNRLSNHTIL